MNITDNLISLSQTHPNKTAIFDSLHQNSYNFSQLEKISNTFAYGFEKLGLTKGDLCLIFLTPTINLSAVVFALMKRGIVPVLMDPGMGPTNLLMAIERIQPKGIIAIPKVHYLSLFKRKFFKSISVWITSGDTAFFRATTLKSLLLQNKSHEDQDQRIDLKLHETAAILFTSGGTGVPKGVLYTQEMFHQQIALLKKMFYLTPHDVDLPGFPLFSLFSLLLGMKSVIPRLDPTQPSKANGKLVTEDLINHEVTFAAGSPSIWENVATYCLDNNVKLPKLKKLVMFGAPVNIELIQKFQKILSHGDVFTPYGATEALPVAYISGKELLNPEIFDFHLQGKGTCVGKCVPEVTIHIIPIADEPVSFFNLQFLQPYQIGEIIIQGPSVSPRYIDNENENRLSKIVNPKNPAEFYHRIGDVGFLDEQKRLWFCGRKSHRVTFKNKTYFSDPVEIVFLQHPEVKKAALIGPAPAIVIQTKRPDIDKSILTQELLKLAQQFSHTKMIEKIYFKDEFPLDVRHQIKIDRTKLQKEIQHATN